MNGGDPLHDQVASNRRRSWLMLAAPVVLVIIVGAALSALFSTGLIGMSATVVVAVVFAVGLVHSSAKIALSLTGARRADVVDHARLHNLVEGLCIASGLPVPELYVVDDPALNAFVVGRDPRHASLAVTAGLVEALERIELEGVLAHQLSLIKNDDIAASTLAVTIVGPLAAAADAGLRRLMYGAQAGGSQAGGPLSVLAVAFVVFAAPAGAAVRFAVAGAHRTPADMAAVEMTRYPPGLISALEKLVDGGAVVHRRSRATAHLWFAEPVEHYDGDDERDMHRSHIFDTHAPLEQRIEALREL